MTCPADTIREALAKVRGYRRDEFGLFPISDVEVDAILAALTELEQQLAAAKVREDRLALGVVTKSNELARAEADRDRLREALEPSNLEGLLADRDRLQEAKDNWHRSYVLCRQERDRLAALVRIGFLVTVGGERATADTVRDPETRALLMTILQATDTEAARAALDRQEQT